MDAVIRPWPEGFGGRPTLTVCVNLRPETFVASCGRSGSREFLGRIEALIASRRLDVDLQTIACLGLCARGPNVRVAPSNSWFHRVGPDDLEALVDRLAQHLAERPAAPG